MFYFDNVIIRGNLDEAKDAYTIYRFENDVLDFFYNLFFENGGVFEISSSCGVVNSSLIGESDVAADPIFMGHRRGTYHNPYHHYPSLHHFMRVIQIKEVIEIDDGIS